MEKSRRKVIFQGTVVMAFLMLMYLPLQGQDLEHINQERIDRTKTGMVVLGAWAIGNIALNPILKSNNDTGPAPHFYDMNVYWNLVNLAIAGYSYYSLTKENPGAFSLVETVNEQKSIEKFLLLNTGLDVGYIASGAYLWERGKNKDSDRLKGFGQAMVLQGGFLFLFDLSFYLIQKKGSAPIMDILENIQMTSNGIGFIHKF